jgi:hypothetical protein
MVLVIYKDRRLAGLPTIGRWRVAFAVAVIIAGVVAMLKIGGYGV